MRKCVNYGMNQNEEYHLARLTYLAGSRIANRINISGNFELAIQWLEISFSLGRKIHNNEVTDAAGNLLLKLLIKN